MSDYVKATDFASKDALSSGDPLKKVRGVEIDAEYTAIQTAIATKLDKASPAMTGTPTAPTPSISASSTQVVNAEWVRSFINTIEPIGTIKAYAGTVGTIPTGWNVCDGTNGTLNLTDRFIASYGPGGVFGQNGTGGYTPGVGSVPIAGTAVAGGDHNHTGVTAGHSLIEAELAPHSHSYTAYSETNSVGGNPATTGNVTPYTTVTTSTVGSGAPHAHGINASGTHTHALGGTAVVPGFFALMFIQKIANV